MTASPRSWKVGRGRGQSGASFGACRPFALRVVSLVSFLVTCWTGRVCCLLLLCFRHVPGLSFGVQANGGHHLEPGRVRLTSRSSLDMLPSGARYETFLRRKACLRILDKHSSLSYFVKLASILRFSAGSLSLSGGFSETGSWSLAREGA